MEQQGFSSLGHERRLPDDVKPGRVSGVLRMETDLHERSIRRDDWPGSNITDLGESSREPDSGSFF